MMCGKKGVSLITVLMFMLVATIAATATFKWLNSEGHSSAARMMRNEARQAAMAGITAARSWMTYHGNETGAIIRQFKGNGNKPIHLNNVLGNNIESANQNFDVWLVGAETESSPYVVKILSTGESRNGSKHSEVAIMKISGLYQVKVPEKKVSISFDRAFFGKTTGITGDDSLESAIINGDFGHQNNVPVISKPLLVTGNFSFQGTTNMGGDLYVGGNFENRGGLFFGNLEMDPHSNDYANCKTPDADTLVVYIGGSITTCEGNVIAVCGDLYVGGSVPPNCHIKVGGNFTVNGHMERGSGGSYGIGVKKNMVFTDNASWSKYEVNYFNSTGGGTVSTFKVTNTLVLPPTMDGQKDENGSYAIDLTGKVMSYTTANTVLREQGNNNNPKKYGVFVEGTTAEQAKAWDRGGKRYFSFNAAKGIENRKVSRWSESDPLLRNIGDNYWNKLRKMYEYQGLIGSDGEVPVPILLNNEDTWTTKTQNAFCHLGTTFNLNNENIEKINKCYKDAGENELYNGFLILEWHSSEKVDPTIALDGKFVFYAPQKLANGHELILPSTTDNSVVLLYLKEGSGMLRGMEGFKQNFFIYSRGDIEEMKELKLEGCVIMDNGSTLRKYQGKNHLKYKAEVVQAVQAAGLIIGNEEFERLANKSSGATSTSGSSDVSDTVYVSVASQLKITMESEYKNNESYGNGDENVKPSILILPRIIYLPKDAKGRLSDYYNVVNLNGANERKNPNNVTCSPMGLPAVEKFKLYASVLPQDVYSCQYTSNNYEKMGFYVVVSGSSGDEPVVKFEKKSIEITKGGTVHVNLKASKAKPATVDVFQSKAPDEWVVTGGTLKKENTDGSKVYSMPFNGDKLAFDVTMKETASGTGSVYFQLVDPCENCVINADSNSTTVTAEGSFTLIRKDVREYCELAEHKDDESCKQGGDLYKKIQTPECGSLTKEGTQWVTADGVGCKMDELNNKWFCSIYITTPVVLKKADNFNDNFCEVVIPPNTSISSAKSETEYLYASVQRRTYNLHIEFKGAEESSDVIEVYNKAKDSDEYVKKYTCKNGEICDYPIYAGYYYQLRAIAKGSDRFSRFTSEPSVAAAQDSLLTILASSDYSVVAYFNDRDEHCFYEDFAPDANNKGFVAFCSESEDFPRCIDVCYTNPQPGMSCKISESMHWVGADAASNPDWVMVYDNRNATSNCQWDYSSCHCSSDDNACRLQCRKRVCTTTKSGERLVPSISNNYITANAAAETSSDVPNGSQSVILNTKDNGSNGTLTSIFSTEIIDVNTTVKNMANSGFIFRANEDASEYYSLSVYGKHAGGAYSPYVYVMLCYVNGQTASDDACAEKFLSTTDWDVSESGGFTNLSKIGLVMNIQGNIVSVNLQLNGNSANASSSGYSFDLNELFGSNLLLNDIHHAHAGFKLSNKDFKLYDISWSSTAYGDNACWDRPRLVCSFKTNYLGGIVPQDENVKPWVGFSSFTMNKYKKCHIKYYYNGCDNAVTSMPSPTNPLYNWEKLYQLYACASGERLGMYWDKGSEVNDPYYRFKTEGKHGYYFEDPESSWGGFAMDAKVALECPPDVKVNVASSLLQTQSCGEFYVGDILMCSKNFDFLNSEEPVFCTDSCSFEVSGNEGVNVRKSKLLVGLNNPNSHNLRISFTDKNKIQSSFYTTAMDGTLSIDVNSISNEDGFDPQHVMSVNVKVVDGSSIEINQLKSSCPNSLSIGSCKVQYDNKHWEITADVKNADRCSVEKPLVSDAEAVGPAEGCPKTFRFKEEGLYSKEDVLSYEFTVKAYKGSGADEEMETLKCDPYKIIPIEVGCDIAESKKTVKQGAGVPSLNLSFTNCPEDGCDYTISFEGSVIARGNTQKEGDKTETYTFTDLNTPLNMLNAKEYSFTVVAGGKENRDCKFTVEETASKAKASNCKFDEDSKTFTAKVNILQGLTWSGEIDLLDYNGIRYRTVQSYVDETSSEISVDLSAVPFSNGQNTISLILNGGASGNENCTKHYMQSTPQSELELTCPSIVSVNGYDKTFEMTPTVKGCENGGCSWSVSGVASVSPASNYTSGTLTVTESYVSSSKEYTFTLSHEGLDSKTCDVTVERASQFELDCEIAKQTDVEPGETITIQPHSVTGCNSDCSYSVEMQNSTSGADYISVVNGTGSNYDGGAISFKGASSGGTKQYRLTVTDAMNSSKSCLFEVGYANSGCRSVVRKMPFSNSNISISDRFVAGCNEIKTVKQCSKAQIQSQACSCSDGLSHTFTINGKTLDCGVYFDDVIPARSTVTLDVPENCTINGNIYLSECYYDPNYVGVGTKLTGNFQSFEPGSNSVYVAAFDNGNRLNCSVSQTASYARTVASVNGCNITINGNNDRSYSSCELEGNADYTLIVKDDAPSDLKCGISW